MFTICGVLHPNAGETERIVAFMRLFQAAKRTSYQAIRHGEEAKSIISKLQSRFIANARWCQWCYDEAMDVIRSQTELIEMYINDLESKLNKSKEKLDTISKVKKRRGIMLRIAKLEEKLAYWQQHKKNGTVPAAVFGGKDNLLALQNGRISKDQWRELRSNSFTSIGQANQKGLTGQYGNANTEIVFLDGNFKLNIYIPPATGSGVKTGQGVPRRECDWISMDLTIPPPYIGALVRHLNMGYAYTVQVLRHDGCFHCHISLPQGDDQKVNKTLSMGGCDLNPQNISVTVVLPNGNFKVAKVFWCPDLPYVSEEKRDQIIGDLARDIAAWLKDHDVTQVALEELHFNSDHDTNKFFNRMSHNFSHRAMFTNLVVRLRKEGIAVFTVDPRFTSLIGFVKYMETYGLAVHQAAAMVIARRALGYSERIPKSIHKMVVAKEADSHLKGWGKLFGMVKHTRRAAIRERAYKRGWVFGEYLDYAKNHRKKKQSSA
jgi:IS605 OrfB family transposase